MRAGRIFIVEVEAAWATWSADVLAHDQAGYALWTAAPERGVLGAMRAFQPDCVLLDLGVESTVEATTLLRQIRGDGLLKHVGALVLARRMEPGHEYRVTLAGADLCLSSSCVTAIALRENVRALIRHVRQRRSCLFNCGPLRIHLKSQRVSLEGRPINLTPMQFDILLRLLEDPARVCPPRHLLGYSANVPIVKARRSARVQISRLRRAFGVYSHIIETVRGLGYRVSLAREKDKSVSSD